MDVVDTLRHQENLVTRELDEDRREQELLDRLRAMYKSQGIDVPERILVEGVKGMKESRFVYTPPRPSLGVTLARIYVSRGRWMRPLLVVAAILVVALGGYYGVYQPYQAWRGEQARIELQEGLPAQMDALYQTIYEETKVQQAVTQAEELRTHGKTAAAEGNRTAAEAALTGLRALRDTLRREYQLLVVNREGVKSGFWTFPEINTAATNYYIVVEALDADGNALSLPVLNEETGKTETVSMWGVRVSESVYKAIEADKRDDGIIQRNLVGRKDYGFLDVTYAMPVLGGAVTRW
jgi:hypothetical protein